MTSIAIQTRTHPINIAQHRKQNKATWRWWKVYNRSGIPIHLAHYRTKVRWVDWIFVVKRDPIFKVKLNHPILECQIEPADKNPPPNTTK